VIEVEAYLHGEKERSDVYTFLEQLAWSELLNKDLKAEEICLELVSFCQEIVLLDYLSDAFDLIRRHFIQEVCKNISFRNDSEVVLFKKIIKAGDFSEEFKNDILGYIQTYWGK
jgi:hypothetical protein